MNTGSLDEFDNSSHQAFVYPVFATLAPFLYPGFNTKLCILLNAFAIVVVGRPKGSLKQKLRALVPCTP